MSDGTFKHLSIQPVSALIQDPYVGELEEMATLLGQEFPGTEAAARTAELPAFLDAVERGVEAHVGACREMWQAVEWWQSDDYDRDEAAEAVDALEERAAKNDPEAQLGGAAVEAVDDAAGPRIRVTADPRDRGALLSPEQAEALGWALIAAAVRARRQPGYGSERD